MTLIKIQRSLPQSSPRLRWPTLLLVGWLVFACSSLDNAAKLSHAIEQASWGYPGATQWSAEKILYSPQSNPDLPYYLVFFPEHRSTLEDLVSAGLPAHLAALVYREMGYLSVGDHPYLIVVQEGERLSFTTHWRRYASVPEILVVAAEGPVTLELSSKGSRMVVRLADEGQ